MIGAGPLGLQGHSLSFLGFGLGLGLWFWKQLLFLSIHLGAGQASGTSRYPKRLSERLCLPVPLGVPSPGQPTFASPPFGSGIMSLVSQRRS